MDLEERLKYTFEVFEAPRSYYIDSDGMAYLFDPVLPSINETINWIDNRLYKSSPLSFKTPTRWPEWKMKSWGYLKKNVRDYYIDNHRDKVENFLRTNVPFFTWAVDPEPLNFREAKPFLKTNRQIMLFFSFVMFIFEYIWDPIYAAMFPSTPEDKQAAKPKGLMSMKKKKDGDAKKDDSSPSKEKREKIE